MRLRDKCRNNLCRKAGTWTCRICQRPVCPNHAALKDGTTTSEVTCLRCLKGVVKRSTMSDTVNGQGGPSK